MILPIYLYGQPVLKKKGVEIQSDYPDLQLLIDNMFETMYKAGGVGLAAQQVGMAIRIFVVDTVQMEDEEDESFKGIKKAFINAEILEETGEEWEYEEGCLSIPDVRGNVSRQGDILIKYQDVDFNEYTEQFSGINARVIQHEYDHIEGKLFIEQLKPLRKRLVKKKLDKIKVGALTPDYKFKPNR